MTKIIKIKPSDYKPVTPSLVQATRTPSGIRVSGQLEASFGYCLSNGGGVFGGWSSQPDSVEAYTDPLGMWPVFYHQDGDTLRISDSLYAIVESLPKAPTLDAYALNVFLHLGFFIDNATPFAGLRVLGSGERLRYDSDGLSISLPTPEPPPEPLTDREEALNEYIRIVEGAVERCLNQVGAPEAMLLSGGRDSRLILMMLHKLGATPKVCVSTGGAGEPGLTDANVAAMLCDRLRIEHHLVVPMGSTTDWWRISHRATHLCSDEHAWLAPAYAHLATLTSVNYDGIAGDVLGGGLFLTDSLVELSQARRWDDAAKIVWPGGGLQGEGSSRAWELLGITRNVSSATREIESVAARFERFASPMSEFFFSSRTRREIALSPYALGRIAGRSLSPFLDQEYVALSRALPAAWRLRKAFHCKAIARAFESMTDVPYAKSGGRRMHATRIDRLRSRMLMTTALRRRGRSDWLATFLTRDGVPVPLRAYMTEILTLSAGASAKD